MGKVGGEKQFVVVEEGWETSVDDGETVCRIERGEGPS
jgi:hypothetical protein